MPASLVFSKFPSSHAFKMHKLARGTFWRQVNRANPNKRNGG